MKTFILYWLHGKSERITGDTIEAAFSAAGYGGGALRALDFYATSTEAEYTWNSATRNWDKIPAETKLQEEAE